MTRELTVSEQVYEIRSEFHEEAERVKANRSDIERQQALRHINALLDAYLDITVEYCYTEGQGSE